MICNAHFLRTKWYEWSTRVITPLRVLQSLLAIKDITISSICFFLSVFSQSFHYWWVGSSTRDITKVGCEVATVAIPSWKLSLARSWPRHEFPSSPKWGQRFSRRTIKVEEIDGNCMKLTKSYRILQGGPKEDRYLRWTLKKNRAKLRGNMIWNADFEGFHVPGNNLLHHLHHRRSKRLRWKCNSNSDRPGKWTVILWDHLNPVYFAWSSAWYGCRLNLLV